MELDKPKFVEPGRLHGSHDPLLKVGEAVIPGDSSGAFKVCNSHRRRRLLRRSYPLVHELFLEIQPTWWIRASAVDLELDHRVNIKWVRPGCPRFAKEV